ncbi:receptor-type tyrosine-protein phosphatase kappa-like [Cloeon dipterum]|uniref:receptor-type tyrosine-protein phosphatase kappa-like n=1 Tax=Cloeon dipterum TaxID=197152 RepID=UPI00321FED8A
MASTVDDFWRMVWQEQVSLIVMLTNLTEGGKVKCEKYWPDADQEAKFGRLTVRNMREEINADYVTRDLLVTRENTKKIVQQLHYTNWPNHGVPLYPQSIAIFREKFTHRNELAPILVHCSAGVGRTGTVILIDACLKMVRSCGQLDVVNIFSQMRKQRANLVDTLEQFEFVHLVLLESILNPKFEINCENFPEEYKHLTSKDNQKINESFELLTEICNKDFQRGDKPAEFEANKCRYPDIISTSSAIVSLFPYGDVTTMNFINAVFVDGYKRAKQFIVTQVPMKNTVWDFWRMIDQFNVKQIIILNESHHSYGDFLPTKQRKLDFDEIEVILDDIDDGKLLKTYEITLDTRGICKKVCVKYASLGWKSEADAPPNLESVIELWEDLKISGGKDIVTIACHDGVTASGLFLAIGFVIEKIKMEQKVDVGLAVRTLRKAKPVFISSGMQFGLLYKAAKFYLSAFETYKNFK